MDDLIKIEMSVSCIFLSKFEILNINLELDISSFYSCKPVFNLIFNYQVIIFIFKKFQVFLFNALFLARTHMKR